MIFGESRVLRSNVAHLTFVLIDIDGCFRGRWTSVDGDTGISESVEYPKVKVVMHAPVVTEAISEKMCEPATTIAVCKERVSYRRRSG